MVIYIQTNSELELTSLIIACAAVLATSFMMLQIYRRDRQEIRELQRFLHKRGFSFRWGCPVINPFIYERLDSLYCYDGKLTESIPATLIFGKYSTGTGRNTVVNSMMGVYFPPNSNLSDGWLLEWKMQVARRGDEWAAHSGVAGMKSEWGMFGPPESLPVRAVRMPDGAIVLAWYCLPLRRNVEDKLNSLTKSLINKQPKELKPEPMVTAKVQLKEMRYYNCPSCRAPVSGSGERIECPYCGRELYASQFPKSIPPRSAQPAFVTKPHRIRYGIPIAVVSVLPVLLSYATEEGLVPVIGLEGGPIAAVGTAIGAAICWIWAGSRIPAISLMLISGLILIFKPIVSPIIRRDYTGEMKAFSLNSETHFYFLVPGVLLTLIGLVFSVILWENRPSADKK